MRERDRDKIFLASARGEPIAVKFFAQYTSTQEPRDNYFQLCAIRLRQAYIFRDEDG